MVTFGTDEYTVQVMTALGIVTCYIMGRSLAWNWLSLGALIFLVPFTFGLYYIPESPPWLVYNDEEDLAFKSMSQIRGEEYDATCEIEHFKVTQEPQSYIDDSLRVIIQKVKMTGETPEVRSDKRKSREKKERKREKKREKRERKEREKEIKR